MLHTTRHFEELVVLRANGQSVLRGFPHARNFVDPFPRVSSNASSSTTPPRPGEHGTFMEYLQ